MGGPPRSVAVPGIALAVFAGAFVHREGGRYAGTACWLFLAGSLLFSGSLYLLALGAPRMTAAGAPLGGFLLLAGWATLAWSAFALRRTPER